MNRTLRSLLPLLLLATAGACASSHDHAAHAAGMSGAACPWDAVHEAVAVVQGTAEHAVRGTVTFTDSAHGVRVVMDVSGLTPGGTHAIHVHEFGDVTDAKAGMSAGGHYNPEGHGHALPEVEHRHAGDLGNLVADASGRARQELTVTNLSVAGMRNPVVGRSVVIHVAPDDGRTQPTGNAGARMAVGVVGIAKPAAAPK